MRVLHSCCIAALWLALGCQPVGEPVSVRIVTWNVANLFNDRRDSPEVLVELVADPESYRARLTAIQRTLRAAAADVVVLQEVENAFVTAELAQNLPDLSHTATGLGNDPRGIDIAVLSRFPVARVRSHAKEVFFSEVAPGVPERYARDCHEVHLDVNGARFVVLGVHFKASGSEESRARRRAEAERTREIADELGEALVVIAGDFNAEPTDDELEPLVPDYPSLAETLPAGMRATHLSGRALDDQRPSPALQVFLQPGSIGIERPPELAAGSDHFPFSSTYVLRP